MRLKRVVEAAVPLRGNESSVATMHISATAIYVFAVVSAKTLCRGLTVHDNVAVAEASNLISVSGSADPVEHREAACCAARSSARGKLPARNGSEDQVI